jgi:hypothetical protein
MPVLMSGFARGAEDVLEEVLEGFGALVEVVCCGALEVDGRESLGKCVH